MPEWMLEIRKHLAGLNLGTEREPEHPTRCENDLHCSAHDDVSQQTWPVVRLAGHVFLESHRDPVAGALVPARCPAFLPPAGHQSRRGRAAPDFRGNRDRALLRY